MHGYGWGRYDISPIYSIPKIFNQLIDDIISLHKGRKIDKVIAIDSVGFVLGTAVALKMNCGLILARKEGKIPLSKDMLIVKSFVDYTGRKKALEVNRSLIEKDSKYLIVDDWVETGAQAQSIIDMIEEMGGFVVGISSVGSDRNSKTEKLFEKYNLKSIGINV